MKGVTAGYPTGAASPPGLAKVQEKHQLNDVDMRVCAGELVCVLGPNGAGKTTLIRVASGMLEAQTGEVRLLGSAMAKRLRGDVARCLAVVEQQQELSVGFTVREVVAMGRAPHQGPWMRLSELDEMAIQSALDRCDVTSLADRPANALSGGEQKRVAIARALTQSPQVLLLDEPGAFLDVKHQLDLYELLAIEVKNRDLACLVVMHDLNIAAQFAHRVILMKGGRVVAEGTVDEVMTWKTLKETFDTDLYCGVNELTGARFFLPMRREGPARG